MSAMRLTLYTLGLLVMAGSAMADRPVTPLSAKAEKVLAGRTPGKPVSCVNANMIDQTEVVDQTAIIYKRSSRLWYVNRPDGGSCSALQADRVLVTHRTTSEICDIDIVQVVDRQSPMEYGTCNLGKFVPYTK